MADDLPFQAEYAKSNRSACKACKEKIDKDSLRIARMVQSSHFDGKVPNWFHYGCFFKKKFGFSDVSQISGFDSLRWEDQEKIKGKLSGESSQAGGTSQVDGPSQDASLGVEYAKSNRSSCKSCEDKIEKGELRVGKNMEPSPDSNAFGKVAMMMHWFHVDCFVEKRSELEVEEVTAEMFPGFTTLSKEDQTLLQKKLGTSKASGKKAGKKRKGSAMEETKGKQNKKLKEEKKGKTEEKKKEEEALKAQSKRIWKIRDALKNECSSNDLKQMLSDNNQPDYGGESVLLDKCADGMAFGALKRCGECGGGSFSYKNDGYYCHGNITEWTKCTNVTKDPERTAWKISTDLKEDIDFLKKFKPKKGKRIFPTVKEVASEASDSQGKDEVDAKPVAVPGKPLSGLTLTVIGTLKTTKATTKSKIEELGGSFKNKVSSELTCCISTSGEVAKNSKKIQDAEKANVPVVSEDYLEAVQTEEALAAISKHSLVPWGTRKNASVEKKGKRPAIDVPDGPVGKKKAASSGGSGKVVEKKVKMSVKGGAVVDPDSGLEDKAHVLQVKGEVYNAVLGMVDITRGTNSYYKLQVLKEDKSSRCYLFRSWGRVGTTIGGNKVEDCYDSDEAISRFTEMYQEKTGNHWFNRKNFVKQAGRFYPLDIDYGQDDDNLQAQTAIAAGSKSTLPLAVQKLVRMIFDIESMKKALLEFEIDLKKMPLGKLSRKQIESAYSILTEAQKLIEEKGSKGAILDASNRFYTLIPHDFGMKIPPLLDNLELIKSKVDMLDNLLDIEVAYSLIKETSDSEDPLDSYYKKLKTHIKPISKEEDEFTMIEKYVNNTHASTHRHYGLEIQEIFRIDREGEKKRYKPFKELPNRKLLWHGSRATNFAGILSQGLRIAPPEAPVTGYMFGKGLYFADMVSKSANYCNTNYSSPVGLMLLCEVALGNMHELTSANYIKKLPPGKHSVKGCGRTAPDPSSDHTASDGTIVPYGNGIVTDINQSSLLYNEYIVYDVAQVNMKYLLQLKFNYD